MSTSKALPRVLLTFSGDLLEWSRFKLALEVSTVLSDYSDSENLIHLCEALKGDMKQLIMERRLQKFTKYSSDRAEMIPATRKKSRYG